MKKDVVIIGAGAAGLMCAIEAGKRGRSVAVIDHAASAARKIRVSGGGRCNFTNRNISSDNYVSMNPHFCISALAGFRPADFVAIVERYGIKYLEKEDGQLFCEKSSADIVHMLLRECGHAGVEVLLGNEVSGVRRDEFYGIRTGKRVFMSHSLVVATGGLSFPGLGATGLGHLIASRFGLRVTELRPGLVPLTLKKEDIDSFSELSGVSAHVAVGCNGKRFTGQMLFTAGGLSGPVVLQTSLYWKKGDALAIDLLPDIDILGLFMQKKREKTEMQNLLSGFLRRRLARKWCDLYAPSRPLCQYGEKELKAVAERLHRWKIVPSGTEGYGKAEVTVGGVDTKELSSKTMEAKKVPGLYFVGEVVDVTGQLGGFNLHWAWASGYAAGQYV